MTAVEGRPTNGRFVWVARHAHARGGVAVEDDRARPLDQRGEEQLRRLRRAIPDVLRRRDVAPPTLVLTSPAQRAAATALALAEVLGAGPPQVVTAMYGADVDDLVDLVRQLDDETTSVLLVGHNPAVAGLVTVLAGERSAPLSFPPSSVAAVALPELAPWHRLTSGDGRLVVQLTG